MDNSALLKSVAAKMSGQWTASGTTPAGGDAPPGPPRPQASIKPRKVLIRANRAARQAARPTV